MRERDRLVDMAARVMRASNADQTEVLVHAHRRALTRFASSAIHQNVEEEDTVVTVRAVLGRKVGVASTNSLDQSSLKGVAERARDIADHQREDPDFESLPLPKAASSVEACCEATAGAEPQRRADVVKEVVEEADRQGLEASGALSTQLDELSVLNSLGVELSHSATWSVLTAVVSSKDSSGYAACCSADLGEIRAKEVAREAVEKCLKGRNPVEIETGRYDVLLEEYAVEEILDWLSYIGFGAVRYQDGRSFMSGRIGEGIMGEKVSIYDDGLDVTAHPLPFDFEGVPKEKVDLIEKGIARGVVHNTLTAGREGRGSTGHAIYPQAASLGPIPLHLHMQPGDSSKQELVSSIEEGIWVTRFHYINGLLDPKIALFTGMTRGGTFLIEKGKVTRPIKNLRFTESMLKAFSNVAGVSKETKVLSSGAFGASVLPAVWIKEFNFTGKTEF